MRFHDVLALSGLAIAVAGGAMMLFWPGARAIGVVIALAGIGLLAYGASFL